jgi:hypothetical protein
MTSFGMPQPPGRWPGRIARLAARVLPAGPARDRYRHEFLAELYGMSAARQIRHATALLTRSFALRAAVDREQQPSTLELITPVTTRKPLRCRLNIRHKWVRRINPDGDDYLQCKRCKKTSMTSTGTTDPTSAATSESAP